MKQMLPAISVPDALRIVARVHDHRRQRDREPGPGADERDRGGESRKQSPRYEPAGAQRGVRRVLHAHHAPGDDVGPRRVGAGVGGETRRSLPGRVIDARRRLGDLLVVAAEREDAQVRGERERARLLRRPQDGREPGAGEVRRVALGEERLGLLRRGMEDVAGELEVPAPRART